MLIIFLSHVHNQGHDSAPSMCVVLPEPEFVPSSSFLTPLWGRPPHPVLQEPVIVVPPPTNAVHGSSRLSSGRIIAALHRLETFLDTLFYWIRLVGFVMLVIPVIIGAIRELALMIVE